jgi:hypothetical protein
VRELRPGLWHWQAPHPDWEPSEPWNEVVSSYAIDDDERLLLFDPIAPPTQIEELAVSRDPVIVLTAPWHERDTRSVVERLSTTTSCPRSRAAERSSTLRDFRVSLPSYRPGH